MSLYLLLVRLLEALASPSSSDEQCRSLTRICNNQNLPGLLTKIPNKLQTNYIPKASTAALLLMMIRNCQISSNQELSAE